MLKKYYLLCIFWAQISQTGYTQEPKHSLANLEILFYNVENLFDCENDSLTNDNEFTALGVRHWSKFKLNKKVKMLSRAILASNDWKSPAIIGLCEIENRTVLNLLIQNSLLRDNNYGIIHHDSKDLRGIDVALIYDTLILQTEFIKYYVINSIARPTRDILYTKFIFDKEYFHILVNHWPSRYSGTLQSESGRMLASKKLKSICDSILKEDPKANLIIMGDFNDNPSNNSLQELCSLIKPSGEHYLINLMSNAKYGTLKFQGIWSVFDQFIISKTLLDSLALKFVVKSLISKVEFLYEKDKKYLGKKPFRTFNGYRYQGGYSDHIPILLRFRPLK